MEIVVLVAFLGGLFYLYTIFSEEEATVTASQVNPGLLGKNFTLFMKAVNEDKISFTAGSADFMKSELVQNLQDFTKEIPETTERGRADPFVPYAFTRSIR